MEKLKQAQNKIKTYLIKRYVKEGEAVLDLGCGAAVDGQRILAQKPSLYMGIDLSISAIKKAQQLYPNSLFEVGDMRDLDDIKSATFDVINTQFCLNYAWHQIEELAEDLHRITKPGARWIGTIVDDAEIRQFKSNSVAQIKWYYDNAYELNGSDEPVIRWNEFASIVADCGWLIVETRNFARYGFHLPEDVFNVHKLYRSFVFSRH